MRWSGRHCDPHALWGDPHRSPPPSRGREIARAAAAVALVALLCAAVTALALTFPPLTGRIVDQANIIPADTRAALESKLADLEQKSGIQLVVATVNSLEGQDIEPYANELFRNWKLGEKAKNNGVLLLVAPNERRVRIEVGYGLEGTLTDALSKIIITNAITPRFKTGDFGGGITRGVDDIITVLTTDASEWQKRPSLRLDHQPNADPVGWILPTTLIVFLILFAVWPGFRWFVLNVLVNILASSGSSRGGYSGGGWSGGGGFSGGGGLSGGGGSSGGGGRSGGWGVTSRPRFANGCRRR